MTLSSLLVPLLVQVPLYQPFPLLHQQVHPIVFRRLRRRRPLPLPLKHRQSSSNPFLPSGSSSSTTESTTTSQASQTTSTTQSNPTTPVTKPVVTRTESVDASETSTAPPQIQSNAAKPKSIALTVLIAVAASVAAVAILWTVFRKWKLGRSSKFDERLQPIDWQPTNPDDGALPGVHRRLSGASSFRSGSGHHNSARGYGTSDHGHDSPSTGWLCRPRAWSQSPAADEPDEPRSQLESPSV
ncbi:hypothetical protein FPV67DRAFT_78284 [Lyophyllum atratum]|nr:hypothetical protein FPV67DRAFT_78284 [Lyophyllum atratum]